MKQIGYIKENPALDAVFSALADPTRRAILIQLADGESSVKELAAPHNMSQPAISRHLKVLENAGLIDRSVDRQKRPATLNAASMEAAVAWLTEFRAFWDKSFDQMDELLVSMKKQRH